MGEAVAEYNWDDVDHTIELRGVYDGWSIAVLKSGQMINRWENRAGDGPEPGYERRWQATKDAMTRWEHHDVP